MTTDTDLIEQILPSEPREPRKGQKRVATVNELLSKRKRRDIVNIPMTDEDGEEFTVTVEYAALSSTSYDKLLAKFPPSASQRKEGLSYDIDGFAPALISAVAVEPLISLEDATALYFSDDWSAGELGTLFLAAQRLCNAGLDVSFTGAG